MEKLVALASAIWIAIAIVIGFICLVASIMIVAVMITASVDKVVGWFKGEYDNDTSR